MMKRRRLWRKALALLLALLLFAPELAAAQGGGEEKPFKQEELDQLLAPLALYPDDLVAQILMAATYPLEVVEAARWAEANKSLQGDALTSALEQQTWDPSVKSLVNFPQVLQMMNEKLDWTQKLGDAFLAQQKDVMTTIQNLRQKAHAQGSLQTSAEQKVIVEQGTQTIIIEPADPKVVYVPVYDPTVVYGPWWYPAYPPYYYYPPGYAPGAALFTFGMGVAIGVAWGYAWGGCAWGHNDIDIDINRNTNINRNIDRSKYAGKVTTGEGGRGSWQHDPQHRKGVSYRDASTAQRYDKGASRDAQSREAFRGRAEAGRQDLARGGADGFRDRSSGSRPAGPAAQQPRRTDGFERSGMGRDVDRSAFGGYENGRQTKSYSSRGRESMGSSRGGGMGRGGGRR